MSINIRPPDDVYWHFRRLRYSSQVGAEYISSEDGFRYLVREDRRICRVSEGLEEETIDSIPLKLPAGAKVLTGTGWGFHLPISVFYQHIIAKSNLLAQKLQNSDDNFNNKQF